MSILPAEEKITVTADAGNVESLADTDQRITVVSQRALGESLGAVVTESAQREAGVQEQRTSAAMGSFFVRGLTGKNVSVYRDGIRYSTSVQRGGVSTFQNLVDPASLESVEFVRGSNSGQYGSDSLGGTVNLVSRGASDRRGISGETAQTLDSATASFGSHLLLSLATPRFDIATAVAGRRVNTTRSPRGLDSHAAVTRFLGLPASVIAARLPDTAFTQYGGSSHLRFRLSGTRHIVAHYERAQQDGGKRYDQLLGGDGNLMADLRNLLLDFAYVRFQGYALGMFDHVSIGMSYNAQREERVNQGGQGNPLASISHQYERLAAWGTQFTVQRTFANWDVAIGGEGYIERVWAPAFVYRPASGAIEQARGRVPDDARYLSHGVYLQNIWRPTNRLRISAAGRFGGASYQSRAVNDSLSANALTGRLGASLQLAGPVAAFGRYSRGFRAPNVTDLGTLGLQGNGAFEANPNDVLHRQATIGDRADDRAAPTGRAVERLRPEFSDNFDGGLALRGRGFMAELSGFRIELRNTIVSQTLLLPPGAVGQPLGDQTITRQLPSGVVFVPLSPNPVLVRSNYFGARLSGMENKLRIPIGPRFVFAANGTWVRAADQRTGLPPEIEPGIPAATLNANLRYVSRRVWLEPFVTLSARQSRLSSLALADRRIGGTRSRTNIANFFANGARVHGLVKDGRLLPTGETLEAVQNRVLGNEASLPLLTALPGFAVAGLKAGIAAGEAWDLLIDVSNLSNKSHRGMGWGMPGRARGVSVRVRYRF